MAIFFLLIVKFISKSIGFRPNNDVNKLLVSQKSEKRCRLNRVNKKCKL